MFSYQTPGCSKSGLFKAFSEFVMGRLGIIQEKHLQVLSTEDSLYTLDTVSGLSGDKYIVTLRKKSQGLNNSVWHEISDSNYTFR